MGMPGWGLSGKRMGHLCFVVLAVAACLLSAASSANADSPTLQGIPTDIGPLEATSPSGAVATWPTPTATDSDNLYRWFVWSGYGSPSANRYGPLLGQSTFVVRR